MASSERHFFIMGHQHSALSYTQNFQTTVWPIRTWLNKGLNYSWNLRDYNWKSGQKDMLWLIKIHICVQHFKTELDANLESNCKGKICTHGEKSALKKDLINAHTYCDDLFSKDVNVVLTNPQEEHRTKRKRDSTIPESWDSPNIQFSSDLELNTYIT